MDPYLQVVRPKHQREPGIDARLIGKVQSRRPNFNTVGRKSLRFDVNPSANTARFRGHITKQMYQHGLSRTFLQSERPVSLCRPLAHSGSCDRGWWPLGMEIFMYGVREPGLGNTRSQGIGFNRWDPELIHQSVSVSLSLGHHVVLSMGRTVQRPYYYCIRTVTGTSLNPTRHNEVLTNSASSARSGFVKLSVTPSASSPTPAHAEASA